MARSCGTVNSSTRTGSSRRVILADTAVFQIDELVGDWQSACSSPKRGGSVRSRAKMLVWGPTADLVGREAAGAGRISR
jgi:hypothetical protein